MLAQDGLFTEKSMKDKILLAIIAILTLTIVVLVGLRWYNGRVQDDVVEQVAPPPVTQTPPVEEGKEYVSPVNFAELDKQNPDIYAWIRINDTCVDYPIVQRAGQNSYYHRRDFLGNSSWNGCIYTEDHNALDFNDKVTVVYGHNIYSGKMFGDLINYTDPAYFKKNSEMTVYLPDCEKKYELYAAIVFDNRHLLYYNDYDDPVQFNELIGTLSDTNLTSVIADGVTVDGDDRLVILSTCYYNQKDKRFLVVWRETEEIK